ncbi:MAG: PilZ domain-containing protein [Planctomycetaceae bacterium]|nr:PilZ domain-containing protein [Planctomycetaceae bacterium]
MVEMAPQERRVHRRYPLAAGVSFVHAPTRRRFPARCVDISRGGLQIYIPAAAPLKAGQPIRLDLPKVEQGELEELGRQSVDCTVIRVDRSTLIEKGYISVGLQFAQA